MLVITATLPHLLKKLSSQERKKFAVSNFICTFAVQLGKRSVFSSGSFATCTRRASDSLIVCGSSSVGRAQPCQGWGRGFESRLPLFFMSVVRLVEVYLPHFLVRGIVVQNVGLLFLPRYITPSIFIKRYRSAWEVKDKGSFFLLAWKKRILLFLLHRHYALFDFLFFCSSFALNPI